MVADKKGQHEHRISICFRADPFRRQVVAIGAVVFKDWERKYQYLGLNWSQFVLSLDSMAMISVQKSLALQVYGIILEIILVMGSANKMRRYYVTSTLNGRVHTQNEAWTLHVTVPTHVLALNGGNLAAARFWLKI